MTTEEILEEIDELNIIEQTKILKKLAEEQFPPNTWEEREIKLLGKLGIKWVFGLDEEEEFDEEEDKFLDNFGNFKSQKDDWL